MSYWDRVKDAAKRLHGDGCSASPDLWFRICCDEHDVIYRTGKDADGKPVSRAGADWRLLRCIQRKSPLAKVYLGGLSPLSYIYYAFVRIGGQSSYKGEK